MADLEAGSAPQVSHSNKKPDDIAGAPNVDEINNEVNDATSDLLLFLKNSYLENNKPLRRHEWKTVGFGLAELRQLSPFRDRSDGALLLSRCIDFGCAITGLVPYTDCENTSDGRILVLRKYRTAETVNATEEGDLEDYRSYQREVAAETVAAIANYVSRRSLRWKGRPIPPFVLDKIAAILLSAASGVSERLALGVVAREHGPEAAFFVTPLVGKPGYRLVRNVVSESYSIEHDGGIKPTETFLKRYVERSLRIARREELLTIESYLQALIPVLDRVENVSELLTCWAVSANGKLGLDYVMADVDFAFEVLSEPLEVLAGRRLLVQRKLILSCKKADHYLGIARKEKLDQLTRDWWTSITEQWLDPIAIEKDLLRTLSAPREATLLYSVAAAYIHTVRFFVATVRMAELLTMGGTQRELFTNSEYDQDRGHVEIIGRLGSIGNRLRSLRDEVSHSVLPKTEEKDQNAELAGLYKRTLDILRRYAAAFAWNYSRLYDLRRLHLPEAVPRNRTILFADLVGSTPAALTLPHDENVRWKNNGLNLLAQWGQAFGAWEGDFPGRKGDDICLEFVDPESAILCAAIAQEHLAALRSTGLRENTYTFRMAIDSFWVSSGDGGNRISLAIDRAAKAARAARSLFSEKTDGAGLIVVTPEVVHECCERLRSFLEESENLLTLGEGDRGAFRPWRVNCCPLLEEYVQRLCAL